MNEHFKLIDSAGEKKSWLAVKKRALYFEPGSAFHYNQTNYLLVGRIIKQVSGKNYAELVTENQLKKANMYRTDAAGFAHFHDVNTHQARNYRLNQKGSLSNVLTYFPSIIRAGAGMSSNAKELADWVIQLQSGMFFEDPSSLKLLWQAETLKNDVWKKENPSMHPYALGWYVVERQKNSKIVSAGGGQSALAVYPQNKLSIVVLTNLAGAKPEGFIDEIAEFYLEDFGLSENMKILKQILEQQKYENVLVIANAFQKKHQISLDAGELNHFGNLLLKHMKSQQAQEIFSLNNRFFSKFVLTDAILDKYLGLYELPDFSINVTRHADALFITATGDNTLPIFSESETKFVLKTLDATITFLKNDSGVVSRLILSINGHKLVGEKID